MPATVLFLECKSYVIVGIYTSTSEFPCGDVRLMCGWCAVMCGDVWFSGTPLADCTILG